LCDLFLILARKRAVFIAEQRITSIEGMLSVLKWQLYGFYQIGVNYVYPENHDKTVKFNSPVFLIALKYLKTQSAPGFELICHCHLFMLLAFNGKLR